MVIIYYKTVDIKTENPKEIEEIFNVEIKEYSGRKVFIVNPKEQNKSEQTILYIHGGAYMAEVTKDHWDFIKKNSRRYKCNRYCSRLPISTKIYI